MSDLKIYTWFAVCENGSNYIKKGLDGCIAFFDEEYYANMARRRAGESHVKKVSFIRENDVMEEIAQLKSAMQSMIDSYENYNSNIENINNLDLAVSKAKQLLQKHKV